MLADYPSNGQNAPNRWAKAQDMPKDQHVHEDGILGRLLAKSKQQSVQSHSLLLGEPNYLGICLKQYPETLD